MKNSIKKIFQNLNTYLFFILFVATLGGLSVLEQSLSYDKTDNLNNQKNIIKELSALNIDDIELAFIQLNAKTAQLHQGIAKLQLLYKYAYVDQYILQNKKEYFADLHKLSKLTNSFSEAVKEYYTALKNKNKLQIFKKRVHTLHFTLNQFIDSMLIKSITYNKEKFFFVKNAIFILFFLILFATIYYRRSLNAIYRDIDYLHQIDKRGKTYTLFSQEADAISLRMNRKNIATDNPDFIDPLTHINNYKGLEYTYSVKKNLKESNITAVTVLEIDNFSKSNRNFPQDITQAILKKIAYTISLHEQPVDVIARTDYNQFTIILSRPTKELAFRDMEMIRESISELKFNIQQQASSNITVSGGFVIKPNNSSLEEAIKQAKEILHYAQVVGKNKILKINDLAFKGI